MLINSLMEKPAGRQARSATLRASFLCEAYTFVGLRRSACQTA
ncbi:MAG: hypothetical protein PHC33_01830 [Candidatus Omnitrophica bacterium]|nr:hypothetical protein [Candidatus Omnitrophota bacterium]